MRRKVIVIGAGLSGLATVKELLEEGHEVVCYEKGHDIGGVFSDVGTYDSVLLTVSNYFMAYSDFMPYDEEVRFWTRKEYKEYLDRYAEHFDIRKNIRFGATLKKLHRLDDGLWRVTLEDEQGNPLTDTADRIAICSGQFQEPNLPKIPGLESFTGKVIHSADYKNANQYDDLKGKRVLCFGMGESAADIITEIAEIAGEMTLSLRRHHMFSFRQFGKHPIDVLQSRQWHSLSAKDKAGSVRRLWQSVESSTDCKATRELASHILKAGDEPGSVVTKTERIFEAVANGMTVNVGGVNRIENNTVFFESGEQQAFDAIVFCTGFKFSLPFLEEQYRFSDIRECYLQTFHPLLKDEIAFIGFARPTQGGVPLIAELLARYYALICSGKRQLPDHLKTLADQDAAMWRQEFYETPNVFGLVNGLRFNEKVAGLIGCRPPRPSVFNLRQFTAYWHNHIWPCQYRIVGPGSREDAKKQWLKAPCRFEDGGKLSFLAMLVMLKSLCVMKVRSFFTKDDYSRWRPIFRG